MAIPAAVDYEGNLLFPTIEITWQIGIAVPIPGTESFETGYITVTKEYSGRFGDYFLLIEQTIDDPYFRNPLLVTVIDAFIAQDPGGTTFHEYAYRDASAGSSYAVQALNGAQVIYGPLPGWPPVPDGLLP